MASDGARSARQESTGPDGVPLEWAAPWEKPQIMEAEEKEGSRRNRQGEEEIGERGRTDERVESLGVGKTREPESTRR